MGEHTPAFKIFHFHFRCETAAINNIPSFQLSTIGVISSGDSRTDRSMMMDMTSVQWTIAEMAEQLYNGASFTLTDPRTDAPKIYGIIKEHLEDWKRIAMQSLVYNDIPLDDLQKLDALATEVYKVARHYIKDPIETGIFKRLEDINKRSFSPAPIKRPNAPDVKPTVLAKEHTSIADTIAQLTINRTGQWRQ